MIALLYVFILHPQKLFPESVVGTLASKYLLILLFIDHFTSDVLFWDAVFPNKRLIKFSLINNAVSHRNRQLPRLSVWA